MYLVQTEIWVPVMPTTVMPPSCFQCPREGLTWRRFAFECAHSTFLEPHRSSGSTWQALKRMAFWSTMHKDFTQWMHSCAVCHQYRTVGVIAPMRSTLASIDETVKLPWADVIIDCQGPFTKSSRGNAYTVSYHCTTLGVCKVEPFASLKKEDFLIALVACVMRARRIPNIVRTDRGPEMTSKINEEFLSICNIKHVKGASLTPRHQGLGEREREDIRKC